MTGISWKSIITHQIICTLQLVVHRKLKIWVGQYLTPFVIAYVVTTFNHPQKKQEKESGTLHGSPDSVILNAFQELTVLSYERMEPIGSNVYRFTTAHHKSKPYVYKGN